MDSSTSTIYELGLRLLRGQEPAENFEAASRELRSASSRVVEVPWCASRIGALSPARLVDVGFSLSSLDLLGVLLDFAGTPGRTLCAVDIVKPERVRSRYPEQWWPSINALEVRQADIRQRPSFGAPFDLVTCISVIEHIGFDEASVDDPASAFVRARREADVRTTRPAEVTRDAMDAMAALLAPGGRLLISVPMGAGGPVILRDSLGYYCAQWEYSPSDWEALAGHPAFEPEEQRFFVVDDDLAWRGAGSARELGGLAHVPLSHSRGVGIAVLRRKHN